MKPLVLVAAFLSVVYLHAAAWAGPGHDHGPAETAPSAPTSARLHAESDLFELVGIADKNVLTMYLDRFATNEPISGATIEFEVNGQKGKAVEQSNHTYAITLVALTQPGTKAFSFTVTSGQEVDLLAASLEIPKLDDHAHHASEEVPWLRPLGYGIAGLAGLAALAWVIRRRQARSIA